MKATEHVHEWAFSIYFPHIYCAAKGCNETMAVVDAEARINEYETLKDELAEHDAYYRKVVDGKCAPDEVHCTCVPALRDKIKQLEAELATYKEQMLEQITRKDKSITENEALRELFWMTLYYWMGPELGPMPTDKEMYNKIADTHALLTREDE